MYLCIIYCVSTYIHNMHVCMYVGMYVCTLYVHGWDILLKMINYDVRKISFFR